MVLKRNQKLNQYLFIIYAGEYFSSSEDVVISTVLGSCVSVCLFDPISKIGGMNHFMLPEDVVLDESIRIYHRNTKYGIHAMDMLINSVLKKGASRKNLQAKIFGGASYAGNQGKVGQNNIRFAEKYLFLEEIEVTGRDIAGEEARKLFFFPQSGKVLLKRIFKTDYFEKVEATDKKYMENKLQAMEQKPSFIDFNQL